MAGAAAAARDVFASPRPCAGEGGTSLTIEVIRADHNLSDRTPVARRDAVGRGTSLTIASPALRDARVGTSLTMLRVVTCAQAREQQQGVGVVDVDVDVAIAPCLQHVELGEQEGGLCAPGAIVSKRPPRPPTGRCP